MTPPDPSAVVAAVEALRVLDPLCPLPAVGAACEVAREALAGRDGASADAVERLVVSAARWSAVRRDLRAFYEAEVGLLDGRALDPRDPVGSTVEQAVNRVLRADPAPLPGWRLAVLAERWTLATGFPPASELVPSTRRSTR